MLDLGRGSCVPSNNIACENDAIADRLVDLCLALAPKRIRTDTAALGADGDEDEDASNASLEVWLEEDGSLSSLPWSSLLLLLLLLEVVVAVIAVVVE